MAVFRCRLLVIASLKQTQKTIKSMPPRGREFACAFPYRCSWENVQRLLAADELPSHAQHQVDIFKVLHLGKLQVGF
eukprot:1560208-Amphidinium_carterae.2